jgi:hypothetical protein
MLVFGMNGLDGICGGGVVDFLGTGNREQGTGNREQGTGNREQGTGNREQGLGILQGWSE